MAGFNFWDWESEDDRNKRRASDFSNVAKESINQANADLFSRDAGNILDNFRQQAQSSWESITAPVEAAATTVADTAGQAGQSAADAFGSWANDRLSQARSGLPGYGAEPEQEQPAAPKPSTLDLRMGAPADELSDRLKPPSLADAFGTSQPPPPEEPAEPVKAPSLADAFGTGLGAVSRNLSKGLNDAASGLAGGLNQTAADIGNQFAPRTEPTAPGFETDQPAAGLGGRFEAIGTENRRRFDEQGEQTGRTQAWNDYLGTLGVTRSASVQRAAQAIASAQARGEPTDSLFDRLKLAIQSGVLGEAAVRALPPAEKLAVKLMADSEDAVAQAADAVLQGFGVGRQSGVSTPNPLGTGKIGGLEVPGLRGAGEFLGVDPNARLGLAETVHTAARLNPLQAVAQAGQFVEHPLEVGGLVAGAHYGPKAVGAVGRAIGNLPPVRRAGEFLGDLRSAGEAMTRGLPGGAPAAGVVEQALPETATGRPVMPAPGGERQPPAEGYARPGDLSNLPPERLPNRELFESFAQQHPEMRLVEGGWTLPRDPAARADLLARIEANVRIQPGLSNPEMEAFLDELARLREGMATGQTQPETGVLGALLSLGSVNRGARSYPLTLRNLTEQTGRPAEELMARTQPDIMAQIHGGTQERGIVMRPEVLWSTIAGDTTNPIMMRMLAGIARPDSFASPILRQRAITQGVTELYRLLGRTESGSPALHGATSDVESVLGYPRNRARTVSAEDMARLSEEFGPAMQADDLGNGQWKVSTPTGGGPDLAWASTEPARWQDLVDSVLGQGPYQGLEGEALRIKRVNRQQALSPSGIGQTKTRFMQSMVGFPDYATLDTRMLRDVFGLTPKTSDLKFSTAEYEALASKLWQLQPDTKYLYGAQWLPWEHLTGEHTTYNALIGVYDRVNAFMARAAEQAKLAGRPIGEVIPALAAEEQRLQIALADPARVVTRIGMSVDAVKQLPPGTSGPTLQRAVPELWKLASDAGVTLEGKPSVGVGGWMSDATGRAYTEGDLDLMVSGPKPAVRWFAASMLHAAPLEEANFLAYQGGGATLDHALAQVTLQGIDDASAREVQHVISTLFPEGWHQRWSKKGDTVDLILGSTDDAAEFSGTVAKAVGVLRDAGYTVANHTVDPAEIEFMDRVRAEQVVRGGPRGATIPHGADEAGVGDATDAGRARAGQAGPGSQEGGPGQAAASGADLYGQGPAPPTPGVEPPGPSLGLVPNRGPASGRGVPVGDPALAAEAARFETGRQGGTRPGGPAAGIVGASDRYYHGTGAAFDTPNPATFDENGLFGPGYYLTSDPRVAGSGDLDRPGYAEQGGVTALPEYLNKAAAGQALDDAARYVESLPSENARAFAEAIRAQAATLPDSSMIHRSDVSGRISGAAMENDTWFNDRALMQATNRIVKDMQLPSGPNVRAVDVPRGLRVFDVEAPLSIQDKNAIARGLSQYEGSSRPTDTARQFLRDLSNYDVNARPADDAHGWLMDRFDGDNTTVNAVLKTAGFDGIKYGGGKRIPMMDADGKPIEHDVVMVFPSSLDKITNATSGRPGGLLPSAAPVAQRLAGQAVGGAVSGGYAASQEEGADIGSIARGAALGAAGGVARGALGRQGGTQALARAVSYGPGTDAIDASITPPPKPSPLANAAKLPTELVRQLFDNAVGLREIGERFGPLQIGSDAYKLLRLARGSAAAANDRIETEIGPALENLGSQGLADLNRLLKSMDIVDKAASTGNPNRNFGGATLADANVAMQEMQQRLGQQGYADLQARADQVWAFGDGLRDRLVQAGVWSAQTAADLRAAHPHYSPIKIADWLEDKAGGKRVGGADSISNSANLIKSLTEEGTARAAETPLDAYVRLAHETERVASKNEAGQAFLGYLRQDPTLAALARPADQVSATALGGQIGPRHPGEQGFHVRENGQELTFWMDPSLEHAFNFTGPELNHWLLKWTARIPAQILRAGATTANALFIPLNAVGDAFTYAVRNGGDLPKSLGNLAAGYAGAISKDADYRAMMRAGGGQAGFWSGEVGAGKPQIEKMAGALSTPRQVWNWVSGLVPAVGQITETGTRLAQFKRDIGEGVETRQAALNARDVTVDFQRFGELTKTLNSIIPFFNVGFQGPAQVARALQNPETRGRAAVGLGAYVIAPAIAAEVYNQQDPTYADVPQYAKDRGLIIMDPRGPGPVDPETGRPTPRYVTIPAREWTPFVITVRESVARAMGQDPRSWQDAAQALFKSGSPIEPGANALFDFLPPAAKVPLEAVTNYDSFRGRPIVPPSLQRLPPAEQYTSQTSETAKKIGGALGASPLQIEHAVTGFGAGVGRQLLGAGDLALQATGQTRAPSRRIAELELQLAKSGIAPEKREILEHELAAEQSKEQARGSLVRAQPVIGGLLSTIYREQGGELTQQAAKGVDERQAAYREKRAPLSAELGRLGINMGDVSPEIGGRRMNRMQEQQYREQALSLREQLIGELVTRPLYQDADDATKTRLVQDAMKRASGWAGQTVLPGAGREGAEFATTRIGKDPATAVEGYLHAIELDQELKDLRENRFVGATGADAEALIKDRGSLAQFISTYGPDRGKTLARRQLGASRYYRALRARERPGYARQSERIRRDEDYQLFVGSAPDIIARRGMTTEDLELAL